MKKLLFILLLLPFAALSQTAGPVVSVNTKTQLKTLNFGSSTKVFVADSNAFYSLCSPCTVDEVYVIAGTSGKKWKKVQDERIIALLGASGVTPFDSTSLSNRINLRVKYSDTASMLSPYARTNQVNAGLAGKQNTLVSGTTIKTVNGNSLLGSGDVTIAGGGSATDTTSLSNRINRKEDKSVSTYFRVGESTFPANGDSIYTNTNFIGFPRFSVFRDGVKQKIDNTYGLNVDTITGRFTFHPALVANEEIEIIANRGTLFRDYNYSVPALDINTIPNVRAWFDATDPATITQTTTVSQWNDKTTNANHVSQATTGNQPTYFSNGGSGNQAFLRFSGGKYLHKTVSYTGAITAYFVVKQPSFTSGAYFYVFGVSGGNQGIQQAYGGTSSTYFGNRAYDGSGSSQTDLNMGDSTWQVVKVTFRGALATKLSKNRLGGYNRFLENVGAGNPGSLVATDVYFHLGTYDISESIIINGEPSTGDNASILTYLMNKYSIVQRPNILFFGDSHTQGLMSGTPTGESYVVLASREKKYDVMNYGYSGTVVWPNGSYAGNTGNNLSDYYNDYDAYLPNNNPYVIFQYGTNDGNNPTFATWKTNYKAYIQHFLDLGVPANKIIICTPPYNTNSTYATNLANAVPVITAIASEMGITLCDFYTDLQTAGLDINAVPSGDLIHGNSTIHRRMADKLKTLLP